LKVHQWHINFDAPLTSPISRSTPAQKDSSPFAPSFFPPPSVIILRRLLAAFSASGVLRNDSNLGLSCPSSYQESGFFEPLFKQHAAVLYGYCAQQDSTVVILSDRAG
jgi:hypothetical protein